jgi:hypothetical protein
MDGISYKCNHHLLSSQMYYPVPALAKYDAADFAAPHLAVEEAYRMARVKAEDIDFAEIFESHVSSIIPTCKATVLPRAGRNCRRPEAIDGQLPCREWTADGEDSA